MHRDMGQPSLAEVLVSETLGQNQRLERIAAAVDRTLWPVIPADDRPLDHQPGRIGGPRAQRAVVHGGGPNWTRRAWC